MERSGPQAIALTLCERWLLFGWAALLTATFLAAGIWLTGVETRRRDDAQNRHEARLDAGAAKSSSADATTPAASRPVGVTAGIYIERILDLSIRDFEWTVEFYVWFRWQGDDVRLENGFEIVDGTIESAKKLRDRVDGASHYELYRVVAKVTKFFDVSRFPCDDHLLTINLEAPAYRRDELVFDPDAANSAVSSRVHVPGYDLGDMSLVERPHAYKTGRGDPEIAPGAATTYSQLRCGIAIGRPDRGLYIKMFQSLFVACAIALLALFIRPTHVDPRFGLGVGALFAAIANSYITNSLVPDTGVLTLADVVNGVAIGVILATLVESTISLYLLDQCGKEAFSRRFDRVSFWIMAAGAVALNTALVVGAAG